METVEQASLENLVETGLLEVEILHPGGLALAQELAELCKIQTVLPPLSVGEMTLRLYAALNYSQNSAHDLRRTVNGT